MEIPTAILVVLVILVIACGLLGGRFRNLQVLRRIHGKSQARLREEISPEQAEAFFSDRDLQKVPEKYRPLSELLLDCGEGNKVYAGNSLEIITSGLRKRELLLEDLRRARKFIFIEYFRFGDDRAGREVRNLLYQKVKEGVEVCLLLNNMTDRLVPRSYYRDMRRHGVNAIPYTHIRTGLYKWIMRINCQNHRKIVVVDGEVGYVGGMNLNDNYFYKWRDTHLRVSGPVIARLMVSFMDSWIGSGGTFSHSLGEFFPKEFPQLPAPLQNKLLQEVVSAPEFPKRTAQLGIEWIVNHAQRYVYVQTPYWVPPKSLLRAFREAVLRGVDVQLMVPREVDTPLMGPVNSTFFKDCLEAGVHLFLRGGEFIHAKTLVADDDISVIGGSNLDWRSFDVNSENDTFIYDEETAQANKRIFLEEKALCQELDLPAWMASRSLGQRFLSVLARLFAFLL